MNQNNKNLLIWLAIGLFVMAFISSLQQSAQVAAIPRVAFSDFLARVGNSEVTDVTIRKSPTGDVTTIMGHDTAGAQFQTNAPDYPNLVDTLTTKGVKINVASPESGWSLGDILIYLLPTLLIIGFWMSMYKQQMGGGGRSGGGPLSFGRSRARLLNVDKTKKAITFEDVAGIEEAKDELQELVDFLKDPTKFQKLGGKIPRGCLLVGPPGTGKTLLAKAIAGEAGVPFFSISGSDFVEMFVGVGASRVRDMFDQGKRHAPCIIFIDEIDAVGRQRGGGMGGNDEREQTLNQLLVEMDGFEDNQSVIIIAATNRPDVLDQALLRPGRFDRQITVPNPDINGRTKILEVHLKKVPKAPDIDASVIARGTPGFSGADLANLVNEAALLAARRGKKVVTMLEMENAKDKVMMGAERKSMVMSEEEKKMTAYHEAGHALVSVHCPASDPIHKATIIPRGRALGMVMRLPESDKVSYKREKMYADLAVAMGGRAAEEIIFGHEKVSSGASSDIQYVTRLSKAMVTEWGMSDKVGPLNYADDNTGYFVKPQTLSDTTAQTIDDEIKALVNGALTKATQILTDHIDDLHKLALTLLEHETLTGDEINALLRGEELKKQPSSAPKAAPVRSTLPSKKRLQG